VGNTVAGGIRGSGGLGTRLVCAGGRGDQGEFVGMLTGDGDAGTRPESGMDSACGRIRGGRILRRCRGSGGLQARMSHKKGRRGHDGRVERLTGGGAARERQEFPPAVESHGGRLRQARRRRERPGRGGQRGGRTRRSRWGSTPFYGGARRP
jgi:hypothetical protein